MGRGDKKSKRGKRFLGSFGNSRPQKTKKTILTKKNPLEKTKKKEVAIVEVEVEAKVASAAKKTAGKKVAAKKASAKTSKAKPE